MQPVITLTTDFGLRDSYVGVMKGVMLGICPTARFVDITHEIAPQDVTAASFVVRAAMPYFPPGTIHLVVVDPGVGTQRHPVALATPEARYVGPDNGVFGLVWRQAQARWQTSELRAVILQEARFWRQQVSATFHGRDIFAPVAAHLAAGVALDTLGPRLEKPVMLTMQEPTWHTLQHLGGQIIYIDHFGNAISNITAAHLGRIGPLPALQVSIGSLRLPLQHTYSSVGAGEALALIGSDGYLEIAVREGSASAVLGIETGTAIAVHKVDQG